MAEVDFDEFEDAVYSPVRDGVRAAQINRLMNYAGAASSVALVVVIGIWGYNLAMRDVNGVPVMRALSGPMRVAPADPGGQEASNQGLSVNAIASTGVASPVAEELKLAPAATGLTADDRAGLAEPVARQAVQTGLTPTASTPGATGVSDLPPMAAQTPQAAPPQAAPPQAAMPATTADAVNAALMEALGTTTSDDSGTGLARSLVPRARPGTASRAASAAAAEPTTIDPATIPAGTRLAQLGAFDTPDEARAKWAALAGTFGEVMNGRSIVIQPAQSGGKTFYRLRAHGFDGEEDARRFCAVLLAGNADCIPVAQR